ncbi:MAG: aspartate-semialdehyde dehydrogenase [Planctomycetota bacterium]|jgi:aspartate-semialdehyde dehydrogenase
MSLTVAVAGATGAVGRVFLELLEEGRIPLASLRPLASERSRGSSVRFGGEEVPVEVLGHDSFGGVDLALFSAGAARSREFAPSAVAAGAVVVDNSSAFRMDPAVPLVVPEINGHALDAHEGIVANPNCTTIVALMAAAPLHREAEVVAMRAASYQAASGAGARAMDELLDQTRAVSRGEPARPEHLPHPIAFNVIPHVGGFLEDGYTEEETKLLTESRKILSHPDLLVSATCVRVPVLRAHCVALWLETRRPLGAARAREVLEAAPGVMVVDDPAALSYPMPVTAAGEAKVQVGRIRADPTVDEGISLFAAGDQLLKGAALNAVQIAETLISSGRI